LRRIQFHWLFTKKKAQQNTHAESRQDRLGRILANINLTFSLPTLRLGFRILHSAAKLFSLALRRPSKLICFLPCGLTNIFYCGASSFFEIAGGGFLMFLAAFCSFLGILMFFHNVLLNVSRVTFNFFDLEGPGESRTLWCAVL
jgi:hypothetical protein